MDAAAIAAVVGGYLIGSIDFGVILPRLRGVDIYGAGSGNPGTTNVLRSMGRTAAALVLLGDLAKGFLAAMAGDLIGGTVVGFAAGAAAVLGHCFPIWHRFRGGRGVATTGGMTLWLSPLLFVVLVGVWAIVVALTRRASLASLAAAVVFITGVGAQGHCGWVLAWAGGATLLVVVRHVPNIRRLLAGNENRIEEEPAAEEGSA